MSLLNGRHPSTVKAAICAGFKDSDRESFFASARKPANFPVSKLSLAENSPLIIAEVTYDTADARLTWLKNTIAKFAGILASSDVPDEKLYLAAFHYPAAGLPTDAVYVVRTASLRLFEQSVLDNPSSSSDKALGRREETTLLNIAGGLLGLLLGHSPGGKPHSVFKSQAAVIEALIAT